MTAHVPTTHPTTQAAHRRSSAEAAPRSHAVTRVPSTSQGRREPETGAELHAEVTPGRMTPSGCRVSAEVRRLRFGMLFVSSQREMWKPLLSLSLSHTHFLPSVLLPPKPQPSLSSCSSITPPLHLSPTLLSSQVCTQSRARLTD